MAEREEEKEGLLGRLSGWAADKAGDMLLGDSNDPGFLRNIGSWLVPDSTQGLIGAGIGALIGGIASKLLNLVLTPIKLISYALPGGKNIRAGINALTSKIGGAAIGGLIGSKIGDSLGNEGEGLVQQFANWTGLTSEPEPEPTPEISPVQESPAADPTDLEAPSALLSSVTPAETPQAGTQFKTAAEAQAVIKNPVALVAAFNQLPQAEQIIMAAEVGQSPQEFAQALMERAQEAEAQGNIVGQAGNTALAAADPSEPAPEEELTNEIT